MVEIVNKLVQQLEEAGHIIIADRGFGSIQLADALKQQGQYCILSCK